MKTWVMRALTASIVAAGSVAGSGALAQGYPARPIELVVGFQAGGGTDVLARAYADAARKHYAQPFVVVNRPGASGSIGLGDVVHAPHDGYKVAVLFAELVTLPYVGIGKVSYADFEPIARLNADPAAITVRADAPWSTIEEFLAYARSKPGQVTVSNSGVGAIYHLAAAALEDKAGVKFSHVPFQGSAPAVLGLLSEQVDATAVSPAELTAHLKAGKLKVLAVMADERNKAAADAPTLKERGIDLSIGTWRGLAVSKGTPAEVVTSLQDLTRKVIGEPGFRDALERQNMGYAYQDAQTFQASLVQQDRYFKQLIPTLGIKN